MLFISCLETRNMSSRAMVAFAAQPSSYRRAPPGAHGRFDAYGRRCSALRSWASVQWRRREGPRGRGISDGYCDGDEELAPICRTSAYLCALPLPLPCPLSCAERSRMLRLSSRQLGRAEVSLAPFRIPTVMRGRAGCDGQLATGARSMGQAGAPWSSSSGGSRACGSRQRGGSRARSVRASNRERGGGGGRGCTTAVRCMQHIGGRRLRAARGRVSCGLHSEMAAGWSSGAACLGRASACVWCASSGAARQCGHGAAAAVRRSNGACMRCAATPAWIHAVVLSSTPAPSLRPRGLSARSAAHAHTRSGVLARPRAPSFAVQCLSAAPGWRAVLLRR